MAKFSRRSFLKNTAWAAAAAAVWPARSWAQTAGANGDIRIAVIGLNGRGKSHIDAFPRIPGVRLVALCDVDTAILNRAAQALRDKGNPVQTYGDARELLARPDIDAVSIATPHHWHALLTIWACQAGKDVYVEKPTCHNVWEGRQMINAAAKYNRVVAVGAQCRSSYSMAEAVAWVKAGNLGRITASRGLCYKPRPSIGLTVGPQPVPATANYDLWLGPAPMVPLRRKNLHYDWHWFWATGNGDLGNQGIHQMDIARWFLGEPALAPRTLSVGARLGYVDDGETANTQVIVHDYERAPLIFEVRGLPTEAYRGAKIGVIVHCEGGTVVVPSYTTAQAFDRDGKQVKEWSGATNHFANFTDVVRSRKLADLHCPLAEGHVSSSLCHTGNISQRLGAATPPGELRERIQGNAGLAEAYGRMAGHLDKDGVDLDKTPAALGAPLIMDPGAERFVGNDAANALLTRDYRAPFVVPAIA
jgi:predicted dehydrogenase